MSDFELVITFRVTIKSRDDEFIKNLPYVPDEFRSKVACENDVINLVCHPGQRVAIFSASFGRTEYESLQCPQPHDVKEESE